MVTLALSVSWMPAPCVLPALLPTGAPSAVTRSITAPSTPFRSSSARPAPRLVTLLIEKLCSRAEAPPVGATLMP
jgi:hypothetical protein